MILKLYNPENEKFINIELVKGKKLNILLISISYSDKDKNFIDMHSTRKIKKS